MNEFFERLKQRKLVQWAIAYVAGAFALLQGSDIVAQQFGWPEGVRRGITLVLVVGFFVTLVLAWFHGERGEQRVSGTELLIISLVLALGGGSLWRFAPNDHKTEAGVTIPEKSIAVLPFESLSDRVTLTSPTECRLKFLGSDQDRYLKVISRPSRLGITTSPPGVEAGGLCSWRSLPPGGQRATCQRSYSRPGSATRCHD
jgi:hypothetical protein